MNTILVTILTSATVAILFFAFQTKFFLETRKYRGLFRDFFAREKNYSTYQKEDNGESITQMTPVGLENSDLNELISEINHYVLKTKGTTDFAVIQNKVERKLNMRYDQSTAKLSFPTYLGLMGTFSGVFLGILMFVIGFDGVDGITDESITNLLIGVLVSMSTSFIGLLFTTWNNAYASEARKKIEEEKNEFYDFIQTELMPTLDVSMVLAITKLHETVDHFEPAFDRVITNFQQTFDRCTQAFGHNFEENVRVVSSAIEIMGANMDKINDNTRIQEQLLTTLRSGELVQGLEKYVEAANSFVSITQSLNKFEEARRMMLAAAQEAINLQNQYSESLKVPREVAVRVNQILDRIKSFEENINELGEELSRREILGNDVVNAIRDQVNGIAKKGRIADKYLGVADGKLEDLFSRQTEVLDTMNQRYSEAIANHIEGFERMLERQTEELRGRHVEFLNAMESVLSLDEVHRDFSNLRKLNDILDQVRILARDSVKGDELQNKLQHIQEEISKIELPTGENRGNGISGIFGNGNAEVGKLRTDNLRLQGDIEKLERQVERMRDEIIELSKPRPVEKPIYQPPVYQQPQQSTQLIAQTGVQATQQVVQRPVESAAHLSMQELRPKPESHDTEPVQPTSNPSKKIEADDTVAEEQEAPQKKNFFSRLFGKSKIDYGR